MAKINLVRIDSRLIHGQVITKWLKIAKAGRIIIVDDELAKDDFMAGIYATAAPKGIAVEIFSVDAAGKAWEKDEMGAGELLVLFKDVDSCHRAFHAGIPMQALQIGGLPSAPGRTTILRAVSVNQKDMDLLKEMNAKGVKIEVHIIPEEPKMDFEQLSKKYGSK